jgi:hypothetical protein
MAQILLAGSTRPQTGALHDVKSRQFEKVTNWKMSEKNPITATEDSRREFLNRAGKVAVTAPAAALLLAASTRASQAQTASSAAPVPPTPIPPP